jgi:hypothetical protein
MAQNKDLKCRNFRGCITAAAKLVFLRSEFYPQTYSTEPSIQISKNADAAIYGSRLYFKSKRSVAKHTSNLIMIN